MANSESILLKMRGIRTAEEVAAAIAAGESVTYEEATSTTTDNARAGR